MDEQFKAFTFFTFEKRAVLIDGKWDARLFFNLYCDLYFFFLQFVFVIKNILKPVQVTQHHPV